MFILLFLNVALFLLEHQDPEKFARVFSFDWNAVRAGEVWRIVTYQFTQDGSGFMQALSLFITLLLLYIMGSALEEEWGTRHFLTLFGLSTLGSAAAAAVLGVTLLGTYFVFFTLLFVYASAFPQQTFYLFAVIPVRVRLLAAFSLAVLLFGAFSGGAANVAALAGAVLAYSYYLSQRVRLPVVVAAIPADAAPSSANRVASSSVQTSARLVAIRQALAGDSRADVERLIAQCERDIVPGVNICPPADYKPESADGYCLRCEGFAECSARALRQHRGQETRSRLAVPTPDAP